MLYWLGTQPVVPALILVVIVTLIYGWLWPLFLTAILASLGNEVHTWNHRKNNNFVIRFLQDAGIVQSAQQHAKHHKPPHDKYYCTLTNFTNAVLERINFWRRLESIIALVGIKPKRMSPERDGV